MLKVADMRKFLRENLKDEYRNSVIELNKMSKSQLRDLMPEMAEQPVEQVEEPKPKAKAKAKPKAKTIKIEDGKRINIGE